MLSSHEKTRRNLNCILLSERRQSEKTAYSVIPTIIHSEKDKTMETVKRSVVVRAQWGRRDEKAKHRAFLGQCKYSLPIIVFHYTFVQPIEWATPRVNLNVNYGLWVIIMCQYRFINCNHSSGRCEQPGRLCILWGKAVYGKSLYVLLNFAANVKLL